VKELSASNATATNPKLTNPELTNPELTNPELTNRGVAGDGLTASLPGVVVFARLVALGLEHDPEKARPGLDPGWRPVFGKDHAQTKV
jgi:hypothetical protein